MTDLDVLRTPIEQLRWWADQSTGEWAKIFNQAAIFLEQNQELTNRQGWAITDLERELRSLRAVLQEIVDEYDDTYDASTDSGTWKGAASIEVKTMERAKALLAAQERKP
jgi:hypothetical protein